MDAEELHAENIDNEFDEQIARIQSHSRAKVQVLKIKKQIAELEQDLELYNDGFITLSELNERVALTANELSKVTRHTGE